MVTNPVCGLNHPVFTADCVSETKPLAPSATMEVVPETMRSPVEATTPVRPEPLPTKLVAEMVPETSNATVGVVQPIPTFPLLLMVIFLLWLAVAHWIYVANIGSLPMPWSNSRAAMLYSDMLRRRTSNTGGIGSKA